MMKNGIQELGDMAEGNCTHYWIIDSDNVGVCQYCDEVRDFGKLLEKAGVFVSGRRGAKARKKVARNPYGGRRKRLKEELL